MVKPDTAVPIYGRDLSMRACDKASLRDSQPLFVFSRGWLARYLERTRKRSLWKRKRPEAASGAPARGNL